MSRPKITLPKCYAFVGIALMLLLIGGFYLKKEPAAPEKKTHVGETPAAAPLADPGSSGNVSQPATEQETEAEEAPKTLVKAPLFKPEGSDLQLTVKFRDDLQFRADKAGGLTLANGDRLPAEVTEAIAALDVRFEPLYSPEMLARLEDLARRAEQRTGNKQPDFSATMSAVVNPHLSADERFAVANKLHALDVVDYVELTSLDQLPPPPGDIAPTSADLTGFPSSNSSGKATFKIRLGDGTPLSIASYLSGDGEIPLFKTYRSWGGKFAGEFRYNQIDDVSDWDGTFDWDRKPNEKSKLFAAGFETTVPGVLARFERATREAPYLLTELAPTELNSILILQGGNLGFEPGSQQTTWTDRNRLLIPGTKLLNGKISTKTGYVTGKLLLIDGETQRIVKMYGAVYQAQGLAVGYFLGEGETGRFVVIPFN